MKFWTDVMGLQYIIRILVSGICGMIIGIERRNRSKEAGIRTHFVVACGAALIMVVSKYAFFDVISTNLYNGADVRLDPSRVASTIASGIGFLGAGMIFVHKNTISGLTTAAGIWATSGVGMAIGAGMYSVGIASTLIILVAQIILHLRGKGDKQIKNKILVIKGIERTDYNEYITKKLGDIGVEVSDSIVYKTGTSKNYTLSLEYPKTMDEDRIISIVEYDCILK